MTIQHTTRTAHTTHARRSGWRALGRRVGGYRCSGSRWRGWRMDRRAMARAAALGTTPAPAAGALRLHRCIALQRHRSAILQAVSALGHHQLAFTNRTLL